MHHLPILMLGVVRPEVCRGHREMGPTENHLNLFILSAPLIIVSIVINHQVGGSSPSQGAIYFLQLTDHCPARALVKGGISDRCHRVGDLAGAISIYMRHPVGRRHEERETHNPLVEGSSPSGPTTSHRNHRGMSLRTGDRSPLDRTSLANQKR